MSNNKQMKNTKRAYVKSLTTTMNIWVIPLFFYSTQKLSGVQFNKYEFIWWVGIPILFLFWVILNFKIDNNSKEMSYAEGYSEGYKRALDYMTLSIEKQIKARQNEQQ